MNFLVFSLVSFWVAHLFNSPRTEIEANFSKHDKMMRRMIETSTSVNKNDPDNLQRDIEQLNSEIEALDEAARTKEIEWNNILYLKKMKEDMLLRLNRKKTVMEIMATKSIDNPESLFLNSNFDLSELNATESKKSGSGGIGPATSFIMSRCNMKSVDLAKEKSNLNELHRYKLVEIFDLFLTFTMPFVFNFAIVPCVLFFFVHAF